MQIVHSQYVFFVMLFTFVLFAAVFAQPVNFSGPELLGKPTDTSITINIVPDENIEYYYEYGLSSGSYTATTPDPATPAFAIADQPHEIVISDLSTNTRYYYRMQYRRSGGSWETPRTEHTFHTQRAPGSTFVFTIIADTHAEFTDSEYQQAIQNVISDQPDIHLDLGDTFMTDYDGSQSAVNDAYMVARDLLYMGGIGQSVPIFLASGNHENEEGWNLDDSPFSPAVASIQARKLYFPTPVSDGFYSGNDDLLTDIDAGTYGDQYREDYYAWTWGDALFVVFDPFQYTMDNPYGNSAGEGSVGEIDPATGDRWNWSLGQEQYDWLKETLQNSTAKYKFMFAHQMLGGEQNYVREGATPAHMFEWGGYNADGSTWGWDTERSGWDPDPIRQLMIDNGVSAFFHGHDHQYAYQVRDGIVYQCLPKPSPGLDFNYYSESDPYTERVIGNSGHLRITVTPTEATVEYVRSNTTGISHFYTIMPNGPEINLSGVPLSEFFSEPGVPSAEQSYTVSGSNLTDDITITAPPDFEISTTSGSGWTSSLTLTQSGGIVAETSIYVYFNRTTEGTSSGNIIHTSSGATVQDVAVSGMASTPGPEIIISGTPLGDFNSEPGIPSDEQSYTVSGNLLTDDITITLPSDFEISLTSGSGWTTSPLVLAHSGGTVVPKTIYVRFNRTTEGTSNGNIIHTSTGATTQNVAVSGTASESLIFLDGAVSSNTADGVGSINVSHTTGTGSDRLMLAGISANSYGSARTISSVTFTPSGGSAIGLSEVVSTENGAGRLSAIYGLVNPPSGQSGTIAVTFSGTINYGIVAGIANFSGVDQSIPWGTFAGNTGQSTTQSVGLTGLSANEVIFDNLFAGAAVIPTMTVDSGQTELWNRSVNRTGGVASIEEATGNSVTMSWSTGATSVNWAICAVAINPALITYDDIVSDYDGSDGFSVTLNHSDGDYLTATGTSGTINSIHVYRIDNNTGIGNTILPSSYIVDPLRYWGVRIFGSSPIYEVVYTYAGHPGISDESSLRLATRSGPSDDTWVVETAVTPNEGNHTLTLSGQTGTEYVLGSGMGDNSLPVELTTFTAEVMDSEVKLYWVTESELNNLGFILERSTEKDAMFKEIASYKTTEDLKGQGNSSIAKEYYCSDRNIERGKTYQYRLVDVHINGELTYHQTVSVTTTHAITEFKLYANYPNPFNPGTNIRFEIPNTGQKQYRITLTIYNTLGEVVKKLYDGYLEGGRHEQYWNGKNDVGQSVGSGVYFMRLLSKDIVKTQKMILLK